MTDQNILHLRKKLLNELISFKKIVAEDKELRKAKEQFLKAKKTLEELKSLSSDDSEYISVADELEKLNSHKRRK